MAITLSILNGFSKFFHCWKISTIYLNKYCELKQRFLHFWHSTDQTIIDNAIDELRGHHRACVQAKGGHFEQLL